MFSFQIVQAFFEIFALRQSEKILAWKVEINCSVVFCQWLVTSPFLTHLRIKCNNIHKSTSKIFKYPSVSRPNVIICQSLYHNPTLLLDILYELQEFILKTILQGQCITLVLCLANLRVQGISNLPKVKVNQLGSNGAWTYIYVC